MNPNIVTPNQVNRILSAGRVLARELIADAIHAAVNEAVTMERRGYNLSTPDDLKIRATALVVMLGRDAGDTEAVQIAVDEIQSAIRGAVSDAAQRGREWYLREFIAVSKGSVQQDATELEKAIRGKTP